MYTRHHADSGLHQRHSYIHIICESAERWLRHLTAALSESFPNRLLMEWSVDVNYSEGAWIWRSCTGNNRQRDRPDLVGALLDRGADVNTRLRSASALHYTAKAGFLESPRVLFDRGADPNSLDSNDATPLIYAFKAGKRANVAAVVGWLVSVGAKAGHENQTGVTPVQATKRMRRPDKAEIISALMG